MPTYEIKTESSQILSGKVLMEIEELIINFFKFNIVDDYRDLPRYIETKENIRRK